MSKAICLFSGGKDSTVALSWAIEHYREVTAVAFNYRRRPRGERIAAREISTRFGIALDEIDLPFLQLAQDFRGSPDEPFRTETAYAPMRNLVFHSVALCLAEMGGADAVVAGHIKSDELAYRDATVEYIEGIYQLAASGTFGYGGSPPASVKVVLPLINLSDSDVIALGRRLLAPLEMTWSCLGNGYRPCGLCVGCQDCLRAFGSKGNE